MNTKSHIDFCVKGNSLQVKQVSDLLGIAATSGFNPNERYTGKAKSGNTIVSVERNRPTFGVWHYSTAGKVDGSNIEDHARYLLSVLEPAKAPIRELVESPAYEVLLSIWYVGPNGFDISSAAISQLATLCSIITVRCFESAEPSSESSDQWHSPVREHGPNTR